MPSLFSSLTTFINKCSMILFVYGRIAEMNLFFVVNSILLGVGLAMDAFSVSLANGLNDPGMNKGRCVRRGRREQCEDAEPGHSNDAGCSNIH